MINLSLKKFSTILLTTALTLVASPAFAGWTADTDAQSTISRMKSEELLQTRADSYFAITLEAITSTPQMSGLTDGPSTKAKYAVIIDGVVDTGGATKKEPKYDKALYTANKSSDRDGDGIACEK